MLVVVGSKNQTKINAVRAAFASYPELFENLEVEGVVVTSDVGEQPISLEATISGAEQRARKTWDTFTSSPASSTPPAYSIGIEAGLVQYLSMEKKDRRRAGVGEKRKDEIPRCWDQTVCALYDGERFHLGFSTAFEHPPQVVARVLQEHVDVSTAYRLCGLTGHQKIGEHGGCVHLLSNGQLDRTTDTKLAVMAALIPILQKDLYRT